MESTALSLNGRHSVAALRLWQVGRLASCRFGRAKRPVRKAQLWLDSSHEVAWTLAPAKLCMHLGQCMNYLVDEFGMTGMLGC